MPLRPNDIATIPPIDKTGEMSAAAALLKRFRKQLTEGELKSPDWQRWVATSLLHGLPEEEKPG